MTKLIPTIIIALAIVVAGTIIANSMSQQFGYGGTVSNTFSGGVTNGTSSVSNNPTTTALAQILDRNLDRQYVSICNASTTAIVYLHFLQATTTSALLSAESGIPISGSTAIAGCYEIDSSNLYLGRIMGISDTSAVEVSYIEK